MIKTFRVQNYKALRDVTLELTPLHVLIGPNDSGKTSILEAVAAQCRMVRFGLNHAFEGRWQGRELVWKQESSGIITLRISLEEGDLHIKHVISCTFAAAGRDTRVALERISVDKTDEEIFSGNSTSNQSTLVNDQSDSRARALKTAMSGLQSYRWVPSQLSLPVVYDFPTHFGMEASGFGLAMYLNDILAYDHQRYGELERRFHLIFPSVDRIRLRREPGFRSASASPEATGLGIYFERAAGDGMFAAAQASDGLLLVLAYLAILYSPQPPRLLLIEEPENGVHPRRLQEVLRILRELVSEQDRTQVVLTTHSPYVVDLFKPEEVTLCLKGLDGAVTTRRLSESKSVREQMDIFQLGEIWTAEGDEALAAPAPAPEAALP